MLTFITTLHIVICFILVFVVLIQSGKEAGLGSMGGSSQTIFGSSGGADFFTKFTSGVAIVFMITSIILSAKKGGARSSSLLDSEPAPTTQSAPATEATPKK